MDMDKNTVLQQSPLTSKPQASQPIILQQEQHPKNKFLLIVSAIITIIILCILSYMFMSNKNANKNVHLLTPTPTSISSKVSNISSSTSIPNPTCKAPEGWKIYTSNSEKICFIYPNDWTIIKPLIRSSISDADAISLQSPSGAIKIFWVSVISGLGGNCDPELPLPDGCPLITVVDKTPIQTPFIYM